MEQEEALVEATSSLSPLRPVDDPCSIILGSPRVRAAARSTFPSMNDEIMSDQDMPPSTQDSLDSSGSSSALSCRAEAASGQSQQQQQQHASSPGGDCNPPAASSSSDINTGAGTSSASWSPFQQPQPRTRRAIAVPVRLDASVHAICYRYAQGRAAAGDGRWQGRTAHLHYFLPENWSPSYKFTVFEDSYILSLAPTDEEMQQQQQQQHSGAREPMRPLRQPPPSRCIRTSPQLRRIRPPREPREPPPLLPTTWHAHCTAPRLAPRENEVPSGHASPPSPLPPSKRWARMSPR